MDKKFNHILRLSNVFSSLMLRIFVVAIAVVTVSPTYAQSVRSERKLITAGNKLYKEGKFAEAIIKYNEALKINPESAVAKFNNGLGRIRMAEKATGNDSLRTKLMQGAVADLSEVAKHGAKKADLASKANYNLGNLSFQQEDYAEAIRLYKQALRLNPGFNDARRNLRIAQLKQQQQQNNQDNNQNQDQDKKDQDKKDQDKDKDQNQNQNKDNNNDQQQDKDKQQPPQENEISRQAAAQILNAVENNEAQTRARKGTNEGQEKASANSNIRKW